MLTPGEQEMFLSGKNKSHRVYERIRVVHHPFQVNLLVTVRTCLLLTHDAPTANAELVESEGPVKARILYNVTND